MLCPQCGLMFLWWESTICAGWSAMILPHTQEVWCAKYVGQCPPTVAIYCSSTSKPRDLNGTRWQKERSLIPMLGTSGILHSTNYGSFVNQLPPFPGEQGMLTSMYAQIWEKEQVISLQFVGSQQDVSHYWRKKWNKSMGSAMTFTIIGRNNETN